MIKQFFKPKNKIHKFFINVITCVCAVICMITICMFDSDSLLPIILFCGSAGWLFLYGVINGDIELGSVDDE